MNTLESTKIRSPNGIEEECSLFIIDDITQPFILHDIMNVGQQYTFGAWIQSPESLNIDIEGFKLYSTSEWQKQSVTFTAVISDLEIYFDSPGIYYIYHSQLEVGNKDTDYRPNPDDIEEEVIEVTRNYSEIAKTTEAIELKVAQHIISIGDHEERIRDAEAAILLHANEIELSVKKDGVIAAINLTSEAAIIDASKIDLVGYVTISDLAEEGSTTIDGSNIVTGTISDITGKNYWDLTNGEFVTKQGTIGGWNINEYSLSYGDTDSNDFILLDPTNKKITSKSGKDSNGYTNKAEFTSGSLKFYKDDTRYTNIHVTKWANQPTVYGLGLNSEYDSKFIAFGHIDTEGATSYTTPFILNFGLDPDGYTEKVIAFNDTRFVGDVYVNGEIYLGNYYLNNLVDSNNADTGIYCSGAFNTSGAISVGNVSRSGYMLDVEGKSYLNGDVFSTGTVEAPTVYGYDVKCGRLIHSAGDAIIQTDANIFKDANTFEISNNSRGLVLGTQAIRPDADDDSRLGNTTYRWTAVYASSSEIATSDRNLKMDFRTFDSDENYIKFFLDLKPTIYKFINGTSNRDHFGFISQDVEESLFKFGFDDLSFAGFCKDVKTINVAEKNEDEDFQIVYDENGEPEYIYSLRYGEFISLNTYMIQKLYFQIEELTEKIDTQKYTIDDLKKTILEQQQIIEQLKEAA